MDFHPVEKNLRESFRVLAFGRPRGDVLELPGLTIASLGVAFQMFNSAFFSGPVGCRDELVRRLRSAERHFGERGLAWSLWICQDWIEPGIRKSLSKVCAESGLRLASDLPGMSVVTLRAARELPHDFKIVEVNSTQKMTDFRLIGSTCFRVPAHWFGEVFGDDVWKGGRFRCFVGYRDGEPVATSALVEAEGVGGIYNVAVLPAHRGRRYAEAMTRHAVAAAGCEAKQFILQATSLGFRMYQRMGFQAVTRILVYVS